MEDRDGRAQYKNLNVVKVCSERDAMKLLYMGDTRRTTAETSLNKCSSRSHCVFTFYIHFFDDAGNTLIQSKLNIVDLAGSERLSKLSLNGVNLSEAKYINLSLHYLEQVISALTETNRAHVPFRNSLLTFMLRDSLSNNGATTMLATLSVSQINYEETMATCKFAQRVAKVNIESSSNAECNSIQEIAYLKSEIQDLRDKLQMRNHVMESKLSKFEEDKCRGEVEDFLNGIADLECDDFRKIKAYFDIFKTRINDNCDVDKYQTIIKQKDEEIQILSKIVDKNVYHGNRITIDTPCALNKDFKKLEFSKPNLNDNLKVAKKYSSQLRELQLKIIDVRAQIEANSNNFVKVNKLETALKHAQVEYRGLLGKIESIKEEVENTPLSVKRTKVRFESKLKNEQIGLSYAKQCNLNNVLMEAKASNVRRVDGSIKNQLVRKLNEDVKANEVVKNDELNSDVVVQPNLKQNFDKAETIFGQEDDKGFKDFLKSVPLTGDAEIDEEIIKFYKLKFKT
ncbi:PREDICTED: kinesin-like protein KIF6 [Nicrophorus vespilloides]|uniref:Kinesin-like protein n=1 Tax=Nicrophorus vespilloides TaxID=110193 RepID=A0ABM1NKH4_NICVS|nr:PREDICTED: kinesin-like protein KIF6 [Nicrophorus vespilloides]